MEPEKEVFLQTRCEQMNIRSPIIISGVGGSGTRVVAEILKRRGVYLGHELNASNDNKWFTLLFKSQAILGNHKLSKDIDVFRRLSIFANAMLGIPINQKADINLVKRAQKECLNPHLKIDALLKGTPQKTLDLHNKWGWKEPNSHLLLLYFLLKFPELKYIHVVRNGLDMSCSSNKDQSRNWRNLYLSREDSPPSDIQEGLSINALRYWIVVNKRILKLSHHFPSSIHFIKYERLCFEPEAEIKKVYKFCGIFDENSQCEILSCINPSSSIGRYRNYNLTTLPASLLDEATNLYNEIS